MAENPGAVIEDVARATQGHAARRDRGAAITHGADRPAAASLPPRCRTSRNGVR